MPTSSREKQSQFILIKERDKIDVPVLSKRTGKWFYISKCKKVFAEFPTAE